MERLSNCNRPPPPPPPPPPPLELTNQKQLSRNVKRQQLLIFLPAIANNPSNPEQSSRQQTGRNHPNRMHSTNRNNVSRFSQRRRRGSWRRKCAAVLHFSGVGPSIARNGGRAGHGVAMGRCSGGAGLITGLIKPRQLVNIQTGDQGH